MGDRDQVIIQPQGIDDLGGRRQQRHDPHAPILPYRGVAVLVREQAAAAQQPSRARPSGSTGPAR
jgi:hypothetical protein